jgi:hypothetical protein
MMLGVTRSVGDFYHQLYGVTWRPEVIEIDLAAECAADGAAAACLSTPSPRLHARPPLVRRDGRASAGGWMASVEPLRVRRSCWCVRAVIASDGVWDHWEFTQAMGELCDGDARPGRPLTTRTRVMDFFEETRSKGEEAFGDGADNLTGIVAVFPAPPVEIGA